MSIGAGAGPSNCVEEVLCLAGQKRFGQLEPGLRPRMGSRAKETKRGSESQQAPGYSKPPG